MESKSNDTRRPRMLILPFPLFVIYYLYSVVVVVLEWSFDRYRRRVRKATPAGHMTVHHKDRDCMMIASLLFGNLNAYRLSRGLPQLVFNEQLELSSLYHGKRMKELGEFEHTLSDGVELDARVKKYGYRFSEVRENLYFLEDPRLSLTELAEQMHQGWIASPGHHANMISATEEVGIGVVRRGNRFWAVQNFGTPRRHRVPQLL